MATNNSAVIGVNLTDTPTSNETGHALGQRTSGTSNTEWVYVQAGTAITQYDTVAIDEDFTIYPVTGALVLAGHAIGFAQVAFADADYGWVATRGTDIRARGTAGCAPDISLYTSPVAGVLNDDVTSTQALIKGVVFVETASGTNKEIIATWPHPSAP